MGKAEPPAYAQRRPRRCSFCGAWFRPPTAVLPGHNRVKFPGGLKPCQGSNRREQIPQLSNPHDPFWRDQAACRDDTSTLFWQETDGPEANEALAFCRRCPVLAECHAWARADEFFHGIAGGVLWSTRTRRTFERDAL